MLVAVWAITFILIVSAGVYAGKAIGKSSQWNGSDRSMGVFAVGAMLGAWQIGGMSIVGAAQNGYTLGIHLELHPGHGSSFQVSEKEHEGKLPSDLP